MAPTDPAAGVPPVTAPPPARTLDFGPHHQPQIAGHKHRYKHRYTHTNTHTHTHHTHTYTHTTHHKAQIHKQPTSSFPPVAITHMAVERRGQIPTGGLSGSGTSPGSRERETDCDVREERPQAKTAIIKDSAQPVVAPGAGATKGRRRAARTSPTESRRARGGLYTASGMDHEANCNIACRSK